MYSAIHLSNSLKDVSGFASLHEALAFATASGRYVLSVNGQRVLWDDFPARSPLAREVGIPPLPLAMLRERF